MSLEAFKENQRRLTEYLDHPDRKREARYLQNLYENVYLRIKRMLAKKFMKEDTKEIREQIKHLNESYGNRL